MLKDKFVSFTSFPNEIYSNIASNTTNGSITKIRIIISKYEVHDIQLRTGLVCRIIMLCSIEYVHSAPAEAGGLIDYLLYTVHLKYPQNYHLRDGSQDQTLSPLTQSFHSMGRYTVKPVDQALENSNTSIIHALTYGACFSI